MVTRIKNGRTVAQQAATKMATDVAAKVQKNVKRAVAGTLAAVSASLPMLGTAVGWLVPLVWTVWGLGLAVMLVLTVLAHWLIGRLHGRFNGGKPTGPSAVPV